MYRSSICAIITTYLHDRNIRYVVEYDDEVIKYEVVLSSKVLKLVEFLDQITAILPISYIIETKKLIITVKPIEDIQERDEQAKLIPVTKEIKEMIINYLRYHSVQYTESSNSITFSIPSKDMLLIDIIFSELFNFLLLLYSKGMQITYAREGDKYKIIFN